MDKKLYTTSSIPKDIIPAMDEALKEVDLIRLGKLPKKSWDDLYSRLKTEKANEEKYA